MSNRGASAVAIAEWDRGLVFWPDDRSDLRIYFWFYEWNLFGAVAPGQISRGYWIPSKSIAADNRSAALSLPGITLQVEAVKDGARLELLVRNCSGRHWTDLAAIVPCLTPGRAIEHPLVPATEMLFDTDQSRTWYHGENGLVPLTGRNIHFCKHLLSDLQKEGSLERRDPSAQTQETPHGAADAPASTNPNLPAESASGLPFAFSAKWPPHTDPSTEGIMIRESGDGWVAGIAWEDHLSAQGHNPWNCMHLSVRVGPLAPGATRKVRGRVYLFSGSRDECLARFRKELQV